MGSYNFPGNIRELEGIIFDAVSVHRSGVLSLEPIREKIFPKLKNRDYVISDTVHEEKIIFTDQLPTIKEIEESLINEALKRADNNQTIAADLLGISRRALNNRLSRKNIPDNKTSNHQT